MRKQITFIVLFFVLQGLFAQDNPANIPTDSLQKIIILKIDSSNVQKKIFDSSKIEAYKNSEEFDYTLAELEPSIFQQFWNWIKKVLRNILEYLFDDIKPITGFLSIVLKALPYILLVIALFFIVKYFLNIRAKSILKGSNKNIVKFGSDEDLIKRDDLETLLKDAIANKEYKIAVRFYYLLILKKLTETDVIDWQQEKTNEDYIKEIKETTLQSTFSEITRVYDYVWYGNFDINEVDFVNTQPLFKSILEKKHG